MQMEIEAICRRRQRTLAKLLMSLACLFLVSSAAFGQGVSGRILGTIQDPTGAAIRRATVTVINQNTGVSTERKTNDTGQYLVENLIPGIYRIEVEATGFLKLISTENVVTVDNATRADFTLKIGQTSETVEVHGGAEVINTTDSSLGEVLDEKEVVTLPLSGGIFSQLVNTVPGSAISINAGAWTGGTGSVEAGSTAGALTPITASVNGMPWEATTYTLDGVSNMELVNAFMNITPALDAIQEVKVSTNDADVSVGTYGGAQVNTIIKSGSNDLHGSAYEFYRGDRFEATPWVNQGPLTQVPAIKNAPWTSNQYGGSIGGPLRKNRLFYFGDFQELRMSTGTNFVLSVPPDLVREGVFTHPYQGTSGMYSNSIYVPNSYNSSTGLATPWGYSAGTNLASTPDANNPNAYIGGCPSDAPAGAQCIPQSIFDPVATNLLASYNFWPKAQNQNSRSNNYTQSIAQPDNTYKFDVKVDYQLSNTNHLFARESYQSRTETQPGPTEFVAEGVDSSPRDHNAVIGLDHIFSATTTNQVRLGFNRFYTVDGGPDNGTNENDKIGLANGNLPNMQGAQGLAYISAGGFTNIGNANWWTNAHRITNVYEITDNVIKVMGRHTLTFGEDVRRLEASLTNGNYPGSGALGFGSDMTNGCAGSGNGTCVSYAGSSWASFLLGLPDWQDRGFIVDSPATRAMLWGIYGQDDFRVSKNLTINMALRWDVITNPVDAHNKQANFDPNTGLLVLATSGNRHPNVDNYYRGIFPRVGFAYAMNNSKTVARGAFGMTHFPDNFGAMGGALEENYPFFSQITGYLTQANTPWMSMSEGSPYLPAGSPYGLYAYVPPTVSGNTVTIPASYYVKYMDRHFRPDEEYSWNFGVQQQFTATTGFSIAYVGTKGVHLYRSYNINALEPGGSYNRPFANIDPQLGNSIAKLASNGNSMYHAMQVELRQNFSHGLQGRLSYTWSKEIDDLNTWNPYDESVDRGEGTGSIPEIPNNIIANLVYQLPFGKGREWFSAIPTPVDWLIGGWQLSGIANMQSGMPMMFWASYDALQTNGEIWDTANSSCPAIHQIGSVNNWFDQSCISDPALDQIGTSGIGKVRAPSYSNMDLSLSKTVSIRERMKLSFQVDAFNALNHPHYGYPDNSMYDKLNESGLGTYEFGTISGSVGMPRSLQLGAHFTF